MIVLAVTSTMLPIIAIVPIHSTLLIDSTSTRAFLFRRDIDWKMFVHSLLSTLFAYGALLHAVILHTGLRRQQIIGTMAACLTGMGIFKIAGSALNGFDYAPYLRIIVFSFVAAFLGTWVAKMVVDRISEELFRFVFRALVTVTAIRLLYVRLAS